MSFPGAFSGHKSQAERICAVFVDDFQRIDTVSEGFTHLSSLAVTNQSVNQYMMEGNLAGLLQRGEYHTDNPEKDDIVTRYQYVCREEIVQILGLVRPAQCGEGPEGGGEPGIQRILILCKVSAAAFRAFVRSASSSYDNLAAVVTVVSRNPVAPPELTGNTPVMNVLQPVEISLVEALRNKISVCRILLPQRPVLPSLPSLQTTAV